MKKKLYNTKLMCLLKKSSYNILNHMFSWRAILIRMLFALARTTFISKCHVLPKIWPWQIDTMLEYFYIKFTLRVRLYSHKDCIVCTMQTSNMITCLQLKMNQQWGTDVYIWGVWHYLDFLAISNYLFINRGKLQTYILGPARSAKG